MRALASLLFAAIVLPVHAGSGGGAEESAFVVRLERLSPPRFTVQATWPSGSRLEMDTTRPGDLPELLAHGWPAFVTNLRVRDATGRALEIVPAAEAGWRLPQGAVGPLEGEYEVDLRLLAEHGWPAPREAAFADEKILSIVGRALFVTTEGERPSTVEFELPAGFRAYAPWDREGAAYQARSVERLRENLIVLSERPPLLTRAAGFRLITFPFGSWKRLESELERIMRAHVRRFVELTDFHGRESYLALLLPVRDGGAESYRQSFALTFDGEPSVANRAVWANLMGHELFHFWNGWLLSGAEYEPSQWFQEGFTEYVANVSTVAAGLVSPAQFRAKLATHVANYRRLTTSLERPGTRKGAPLYSAGALVAFSCDVWIRETTHGARNLGDFLRRLSRRTAGGERRYEREDLIAALHATAERDWGAFFDAHVAGTAPLPLEQVFALAGLRLVEDAEGTVRVDEDRDSGRLWRAIASGR